MGDYIEPINFGDEVLIFEADNKDEEEDIFSTKHYPFNTTTPNKQFQRRKRRQQQREKTTEKERNSLLSNEVDSAMKKVDSSPVVVQNYKEIMKQNSFKFEKERQPRRRSLISRAA